MSKKENEKPKNCDKCGHRAKAMGEALMSAVMCSNERCGEFVMGINIDAVDFWNRGLRGLRREGED